MGLNQLQFLVSFLVLHVTAGSEIVVQINTKKWIYYVPERFLSLTVDPLTLASASPLTQESFNMAKGMSPCFVRLGGVGTNAVFFGKTFMENSTTVSETQWDSVNDFAKNTGLDVIASLNPTMRSEGVWDSENSNKLISYSAKKRYGVAWQLGYDMRGYDATGTEVGKDLVKLKKMLDGVSNYANSPVFGPDLTSTNSAKQIHFIKDLITNAGNPLACLILRPDFKKDAQPEDPLELMASMTNELDMYVWNKDMRLGKTIPKKPVWIAEPVASQGSFEETMKFVKRIGHAARLGVQIYLRQAGATALKSPTPDYWFSLLYKTLVGQGVLDYKIVSQNQTGLHVFTHCTAVVPQEKSVLDTDWNYEKGAVTIFGVNESPEPTKMVLKVTSKEEPIHIYTLTSTKKNAISDNSIVTTLLNGQELKLSPTSELPVLSPKVKKPSKTSSVMIPGGSIFFVVMPDSKVRTCSVAPITAPDLNLSELTRRLRLGSQRKSEESNENTDDEISLSKEEVYVSFKKKRSAKLSKDPELLPKPDILGKSVMRTLISKLAPRRIDIKTEAEPDEAPVKYITFNENSFLNKLAEGVKEDSEGDSEEANSKTDLKSNVKYKYPALASAIKASNSDLRSDAATPKRYVAIGAKDEGKIQVNIDPLESGSYDGKTLLRSRRSSIEEPPVEHSQSDSEPTKIISSLMEAKKKGTPLSGEMSEIDAKLKEHDVVWKLPEDLEEKARNARQASIVQGSVIPKVDLADKPRNVRHAGDASEEEESSKRVEDATAEEDAEKDVETAALAKVVEKTEKISSVSESPQSVVVEDVPQEKLEDLMLKTAKSNSEPEPDGSSKDEGSNSLLMSTALPGATTEKAENIPMLILPVQQPISLIGQPSGQNSPLPGQFNPMLVPSHVIMKAQENEPKMADQDSDLSPPSTMDAPLDNPTVNPEAPYYNEKKETVINNILKEITRKENLALANLPTEGLKPGVVAEIKPKEIVPVDVEGQTVLITPTDLSALKQPEDSVPGKNVEKSADVKGDSGSQTLADSGQHLDLASEVGSEEPPSLKVARQVRIRLPIPATATPKAATATLAAPVAEPPPTTPGPVSPFPSVKKPLAANQIPLSGKPLAASQLPPLKAPTPEELRERYKVLRDKMLELRQQYMDAREKKLGEFRQQVALARVTPDTDDAVKSAIKRREAELKEWFKKFDKREIDPAQPHSPDLAKSRPRRLTMFTNDENLDMEKFFEDDPIESYNYKRSPEVAPPQQQYLSQPKKGENLGKFLVPLESKTPQGIVYNNRIYPARIYEYVAPPSYGDGKDGLQSPYGQYKVRETADVRPSITKERLAYVPKDAFIREFKSDFVPVVLLDPEEPIQPTRAKRSISARPKRSTLSELEEEFHHLKDDLFPKITSWIKNLSEHPPWKRDLQRSSRVSRSVKEILLTNDLRSLKYHPNSLRADASNVLAIEDSVLQNIDKAAEDIHEEAQKYSGLVDEMVPDMKTDGYCEEIGTSGKSVIRDPFEEKSKNSRKASIDESNHPNPSGRGHPRTMPLSSSENKEEKPSNGKPLDENSENDEETAFGTIIVNKIRQFFGDLKQMIGASDR